MAAERVTVRSLFLLNSECVAVHGRTGTFLNEIEISGHSSVAWENGWGTKLAFGLWVASAAAPLIGASAGGGMGTRRRARAAPRLAARSLTVGMIFSRSPFCSNHCGPSTFFRGVQTWFDTTIFSVSKRIMKDRIRTPNT
jgi:hypothetical protein